MVAPCRALAGDEIAWSEPEVIAEHVPGGRIGIPLRGLLEPGGRTFVVWAEERASGGGRLLDDRSSASRIVVAERDAKGAWARTELASIENVSDLEPKMVRADDGTIVVAWGAGLGLKGGGFCLRKPGAESWTKPLPIHPKCSGGVDLAGGPKVVAAFERAVRKTDLGKLLGNVVHDPPRQEYDKISVAQLDGDAWTETAILEKDNFLRCEDPSLAGDRVVYFREPERESSSRVLVESLLSGKAPSEVVSETTAFRYGTSATAAIQGQEPLVAYRDEGGVVLRRRAKDGWGEPRVVIPGFGYGIQILPTAATIHVVCATGGQGTVHYAAVRAGGDRPATSSFPGWRCAVALDKGSPVLFISQQEKVTGLSTADYRIVRVRRTE